MVDNCFAELIINHMVEYTSEHLDSVFQALADPTRRGMLIALGGGASSISDLARPYDMSLAAASKHIKKLEAAGLIEREVVGRVHHCRLSPERLRAARDWLQVYERFWNKNLDALEAALLLDSEKPPETSPGGLPEPANDKKGIDHANDE